MAKTTIPRKCQWCGNTFDCVPSVIKYGRGKYCGDYCKYAARGTPEERFWAKVDKNGSVPAHMPELGPCWVWTGASNNFGHGSFSVKHKMRGAHCFSYELQYGSIPEGLCVLHRCDNPPCVRPDHLFTGTKKDNAQDMVSKGRHNRGNKPRHTKLTEAQVKEIRTRYKKGVVRHEDLAREYGVHPTTIHYVVVRKKWSHVQ